MKCDILYNMKGSYKNGVFTPDSISFVDTFLLLVRI